MNNVQLLLGLSPRGVFPACVWPGAVAGQYSEQEGCLAPTCASAGDTCVLVWASMHPKHQDIAHGD